MSADRYSELVDMVRGYGGGLLRQYPAALAAYETAANFVERFCDLAKHIFKQQQLSTHHFTVSTLVLSPDRRACLLCFHKKCLQWIPLGGHLEMTDVSIYGGALREAVEESGLLSSQLQPLGWCAGKPLSHHTQSAPDSYLVDLDIHSIQAWQQDPAHYHYDLRFVLVANSLEICPAVELEKLQWFGLEEALIVSGEPSTQRLINKAAWIIGHSC